MPRDNRFFYCHNNNCQSRGECVYPAVTPTTPVFFGKGDNKDDCEDFAELVNGGAIGLDDRVKRFNFYWDLLK